MLLFIQLILSIPGASSALRMRVWRQLKTLGAVDLRDGVYLLPENELHRQAFEKIAGELSQEGGTAHLFSIKPEEKEQDRLKLLFDRGSDYRGVLDELHAIKKQLKDRKRADENINTLRELRKQFEAISMIDFFPGKAKLDTEDYLNQLELLFSKGQSLGEPAFVRSMIKARRIEDYRNKSWSTRNHLWVDRMASAWFIKRFIDPGASFLWFQEGKKVPARSIGFDFEGAEFTHADNKVTFEVLMIAFGMQTDEGLNALARLVHFLDAGGVPVAGSEGSELVLKGLVALNKDDDQLHAISLPVFDGLYAYYSKKNESL